VLSKKVNNESLALVNLQSHCIRSAKVFKGPPVVPERVPGKKTPNDRGNRRRPGAEQKMKMIWNQRPCITYRICLLKDSS